jgi:predicted PurR-regulated permease PerM
MSDAKHDERPASGFVSRLTSVLRRSGSAGKRVAVSITEEDRSVSVFSASEGPDGGVSTTTEEELDLQTLISVGETEDLSAQEIVDEIHSAAEAEAGVSDEQQYGRVGRPFNRRSPFYIGLTGALGVAVAATLAWTVIAAGQILVLLALALFIAVGLDPAVARLHRHGLPRWLAVVIVLIGALGIFAGFVALAIPVLVTQASALAHQLPHYLHILKNHNTTLGKLNTRFHIVASLQRLVNGGASSALAGGVLGVGKAILDAVASAVIVLIVAIYLLADLPRVKRGIYQLAPRTRRARMVLLTDEVVNRVGGYVLGNLATSLIAGLGTWAWALIFGIPYALLLGLLVAILDLIPVVGSTIGGIIVALVALTISPAVAIATAVFYFVYRFIEDYVLTPRIMSRTVDVPGLVTVVATVVGGALLGIIGALIAIPVAAAIKLVLEEVTLPRLEQI